MFTETKVRILKREIETLDATGIEERERAESWKRIIMMDKLVTKTGGDKGEGLNNKLRRRLLAAEDGSWLDLATELVEKDIDEEPRKKVKTKDEQEKGLAKKVRACAREGS